ncbi:MAG: hypothetical protein WCI71_18560, partial [Bacteroidota bacterium]
DFPSRIRRKMFILDIDSYYQGVFKREEIKANFDLSHERIEQLFENSITEDLRVLMEENNG